MMRHLSNEIYDRACWVVRKHGRDMSAAMSDGLQHYYYDGDRLWLSLDGSGRLIVQDGRDSATIMVREGNGVLSETSPDEVLEETLEHLRKLMILENLADV